MILEVSPFGPKSRLLARWPLTTEILTSLLPWAQSAKRRRRFCRSIPNKDRLGRPITTTRWIREAQEILTRIGEGYTTTPPHDGGWETASGQLRRERTVIVYTYVKPDRFLAQVRALREFLHRFGRETNQEVVVAELSGAEGSWFFRITVYDD